jgi:hypothetical protein
LGFEFQIDVNPSLCDEVVTFFGIAGASIAKVNPGRVTAHDIAVSRALSNCQIDTHQGTSRHITDGSDASATVLDIPSRKQLHE